jgi:O-antigen/teichoic acid export membrane protein
MTPRGDGRRAHAALIASQVASSAGSLALLLVTARALGPDGRGVFAFFLLWPALGGYLLALGLPGANLKLVAEAPGRTRALMGNALLMTAPVGGLAALPLLLGPPDWLLGPMPLTIAWLAWAATVAAVAFNGLTWIQMGRGSYIFPSLLKGALPFGAAAILVGWAALPGPGPTTQDSCAVYAACAAAATLLAAVALVRAAGPPATDRRLLASSLSFGARYQVGLVSSQVGYRADQWVLGATHSPADLGIYSVAVSTSEAATYAATARGMTVFRESARGERARPRRLIAGIVAVTALSAALIALIAVWAVPLVFGSAFEDAVPLLAILLPGTIGAGLARACGNVLSGRGRPGLVAVVASTQALLMLAGFLVLIPPHGATAAAAVSTAGYLLGGAACALLMARVAARQPVP